MDYICSPTTALAFAKLESRILVLSGEGLWLRVFDQQTNRLLLSKRVFGAQAIHGIACSAIISLIPGKQRFIRALIWGGRSICVSNIAWDASSPDLTLEDVVPELQAEDWILDACFKPPSASSKSDVDFFGAVLITSHNVLLCLSTRIDPSSKAGNCSLLNRVAAGPRSILYSAHVLWPLTGLGLVAAGTVNGEVLFWSFLSHNSTAEPILSFSSRLHNTLRGHEGSVFGVRISDEFFDAKLNRSRRILASCSDDRTVRIWNISLSTFDVIKNGSRKGFLNTTHGIFDEDLGNGKSLALATAMGHASRIWGLRFLGQVDSNWHLLSLGEDSTAQIWRLQRQPNTTTSYQESHNAESFLLQYLSTYKFHSGKNIWASAAYSHPDTSILICNGGADGRIVCFTIGKDLAKVGHTLQCWTIDEVIKNIDNGFASHHTNMTAPERVEPSPGDIFIALEGNWRLYRNLKSAIATYPSGIFEGTAIFKKRLPSDVLYDAEYLYIEEGKFTTGRGLSFAATRRYVYRHQKDKDMISAWFVKPDDGTVVDYLFHELDFVTQVGASVGLNDDRKALVLHAQGYHLCIEDIYQPVYKFRFKHMKLDTWSLKYTVKGPNKDYTADSCYARETSIKDWKHRPDLERITKITPIMTASSEDTLLFRKPTLKLGSFKTYTWVNDHEFLVSTEQGGLLLGTLGNSRKFCTLPMEDSLTGVSWAIITELDDLRVCCILTRIPSYEMVIFAGRPGTIYIYRHHDRSIYSLAKIAGKVDYMKVHLVHNLRTGSSKTYGLSNALVPISCLASSTVHLYFIEISTGTSVCSILQELVLNRSRSFIVTSSCFIERENIMILGSRNGALAFYNLHSKEISETSLAVSLNVEHIHGNDAVTVIDEVAITPAEKTTNAIYIVTTGRNGTYAIHQIRFNVKASLQRSVDFQTVHVGTPPLGPQIEGASFHQSTNDLLLWGFRSQQFVLWNESQKTEIMRVECGGVHRNWAFSLSRDDAGGSLVWTRASTCHIQFQPQASHRVLQYGGHGREIKAMALSPLIANNGLEHRYIATGAEDTAIRIFDYSAAESNHSKQTFNCLGIFTKHTTGIQQLRWSINGEFLFSAGGCEEFFVWRIRPVPCMELGVMCVAQCPPVTESSDLRIMDFDIIGIRNGNRPGSDSNANAYLLSMVYSDSSVRVSFSPPVTINERNLTARNRSIPTAPPHPCAHSPSSPRPRIQAIASSNPPHSALANPFTSAQQAQTATSRSGRSRLSCLRMESPQARMAASPSNLPVSFRHGKKTPSLSH